MGRSHLSETMQPAAPLGAPGGQGKGVRGGEDRRQVRGEKTRRCQDRRSKEGSRLLLCLNSLPSPHLSLCSAPTPLYKPHCSLLCPPPDFQYVSCARVLAPYHELDEEVGWKVRWDTNVQISVSGEWDTCQQEALRVLTPPPTRLRQQPEPSPHGALVADKPAHKVKFYHRLAGRPWTMSQPCCSACHL